MTIQDHLLVGARLEPVGNLNGGRPMPIRRCLVIHFTAGSSVQGTFSHWRSPDSRKIDLGAHITIDRDGTIYQSRRFDRTISHAGTSRWVDPKTGKRYTSCNGFAIGIELVNAGSSAAIRRWAEQHDPAYAGTVKARHRNGGPEQIWEAYSKQQITAVTEVSRLLVQSYNLDDVTGHDCISPERKDDPGPAFPMLTFREALGFKGLPVVHSK
jgi:N-acetylmuramoyl-L-alanine amidase